MHVKLRNLVAGRPDIKLRKRTGRTARAVRPSKANELWYKAQLRMLVKHLTASTEAAILPVLKAVWPAPAETTNDAEETVNQRLKRQLEELARKFGGIDKMAERLANEAATRALRSTDTRLAASIKSSTGVDISPTLTMSPNISTAFDFATKANVDLIKSIPSQYFDKVQDAVSKNFIAGNRFEDVAASIKETGGVTDSRANLIARDQTSKMNGAFNEVRQTDLGIDSYIWQGAEDERERETHLANEGLVFSWASPPETGHPGDDVQCRCVAIPYFNLDD